MPLLYINERMIFQANNLYHVYNQGNDKQLIFQENKDYDRFMVKTRILIVPNGKVVAYCLMPNHFHFLVRANEVSVAPIKLGSLISNKLSNGFRLLLSEYAQEYNNKYDRTGSLFRQKTKAKCLNESPHNYAMTCFHYIHQNPLMANLVNDPADWKYSSIREYIYPKTKGICQTEIAFREIGITIEDLQTRKGKVLDKGSINNIFYKK